MQKFTKTQKGKYLVMLFDEGHLDVCKGCELYDYLKSCGFRTEYVGCFGGNEVFRFHTKQEHE